MCHPEFVRLEQVYEKKTITQIKRTLRDAISNLDDWQNVKTGQHLGSKLGATDLNYITFRLEMNWSDFHYSGIQRQ